MAECIICGSRIGFWEGDEHRRCKSCIKKNVWPEDHPNYSKEQAERASIIEERQEAIEAILLTTETAPNLPITERIEIVTAECAFGMNIFKDLFAGVRDVIGGRSEAVQKTMRDARRTALYELKKEAHAVGANAVVGVDLDYVELSVAANMVLLVASGTAVRISKNTRQTE
ncbi:YbjQ family protein [Pontivivens nitratireducens]|uniref:YbjQ family protein n=1 Tax=Pontivivens nitratireducens TaxID=2758038 RepID=UPI001639F220|nr:YbjQ family protein [Pontibrevibacter nitratireducens]